nr:uncharacterized protein LOC111415336 [Onthophagus taurus]
METVVRIDHGAPAAMSYAQRQQQHRQNITVQQDLYKPVRSPLAPAQPRYQFPTAAPSPHQQQQQQQPPTSLPPQLAAAHQLVTVATPVGQRYLQAAPPPQQQQQQPPQQQAPPPPLPSTYRDYRHQTRISLLPPPEYAGGRGPGREVLLQGGAAQIAIAAAVAQQQHQEQQQQLQGQQPFPKKIRLQDHKDVQPLRIDTREQSGVYNPQVEAISPTIPDHIQQEDQLFRTTKDELLQQISRVDRQISKAESEIIKLREKQTELEESAKKPKGKQKVEEETQQKHQSLAQQIYAENRRKAQNAHSKLDALGPKADWPMYNQPSDAPVYHENKRKNVAFKRRLLDYFKKRHAEKDGRNLHLIETYSKMMQDWHRKVEKTESSSKRKTKEVKNREFFERVFPELRKQREDKERFNRVGARIKSEADMEEIMDNLQEQVLEDKKMRSYAVIPPVMLDGKERKLVYQNNNGCVEDMAAVHKSRQFLNVWTQAEKEVFKEKYLQHPKNFYLIASCLEKKSVADCVQYYYLSKKTENYKQLLKRSRQRTRHRPPKTNPTGVDNLPPGVVTRHQKEQQLKTNNTTQPNYDPSDTSTTNPTQNVSNTTAAVTPTTTSVTSSPSPAPASTPNTVVSSSGPSTTSTTAATTTVVTVKTEISPVEAITTPTAGNGGEEKVDVTSGGDAKKPALAEIKTEIVSDATSVVDGLIEVKQEEITVEDVVVKEEVVVKVEESGGDDGSVDQNNFTPTNLIVENKKKKDRRKDIDDHHLDESSCSEDETNNLHDKSTQGQCIVCGSQLGPQLQSRPLAPNQASLYGLREDQVPANGRICNTCRCKSVRSRYTHCPLPTCPNARGRVKRLRSLPQRLQEIPQDVRDQLLAEFHVSSGVVKCCSACFNRIQRRLGVVEDWPEEEVGQLRAALTELGANWQLVGEKLNKTASQVRGFYATNRKRLGLESCLGDRKPTLTDEEESGSSTSSCEEPVSGGRERHSSDTVSAESPPVNHENREKNPTRKEDYDSSATETADEGQTPDHYQGSATITPVHPDGQRQIITSPITVKDMMLKVIERSLKKTSSGQQPQQPPGAPGGPVIGMAPTISSILNDSNEVTIVSEYTLPNQPQSRQQQLLQSSHHPQQQQRNEISIDKLTPLIGATITAVPVQVPVQVAPQVDHRNDLVVMQVDGGGMRGEPENLTLDLSIKKSSRDLPPPPPSSSAGQHKMMRNEPPSGGYVYHTQERKSPAVYVTATPTGRVPTKISPKPANPKAGSITMGTPIIPQPTRYEGGLLRQLPPESTKMGSITQGTPIHVPHQDKRIYDPYFTTKRPPNPTQQYQPNHQYRTAPYSVEHQLSNRQIIMTDYITSQHMPGRRPEKQYYPSMRTPPPPTAQVVQSQQQRQGVIQRHNTRPHYPPPPPGHEALNSLVDIAVQQPSLPVPNAPPHEGLGKTIADNILEQPHRYMLQQQQQLRQQQQQQHQHQQQRIEAERR